jgi:hypothetical protein
MGHYAKVVDGKVSTVITATADFFTTFVDSSPGTWIKTSYNTRGGIHYEPNVNPPVPSADQSKAIRANYAGIGYIYDATNDVFYTTQPYPSWTISAPTWIWQPPIPYPDDGKMYTWDEATLSWVEVQPPGA